MSKQSEAKAKEKQGYVPKLELKFCSRCAYLKGYEIENRRVNLRCFMGGFPINGVGGTCDEWKGMP